MGKNGTVVTILNVYNGSLCHFCFGLETNQVEKSSTEPVVSFNSTRKAVTEKKDYDTQVDSEEGRCNNASLLHPCTGGERLCFSTVYEDSCCHLVVEKTQDWDKVGRATKSGENIPESFTVDRVEGLSQVNESHVTILVLFPTFLLNY